MDDIGTNKGIISTLGGNTGYELLRHTSNVLKLSTGTGAATVTFTHGTVLSASTWYFAYLQYDGSAVGLSVNNSALSTNAQAFSAGSNNFTLGIDLSLSFPMDGRLAMWLAGNGTLSTADITYLYNNGRGRRYPGGWT